MTNSIRPIFPETAHCSFVDEADEWCPGGTPCGDDAWDDQGAHGVDEADESYFGSRLLPRGALSWKSIDEVTFRFSA